MGSSVEVRELEVFLALADELHFGRTGDRLGLTPSRVSQILRGLERKLGGQLLYRTSRRVELTALGERFREEARAVVDQLSDVVDRTRREVQDRRSVLRLGLFADPAVSHVAQIVKAFEEAYPECVVKGTEVPIDDIFGPLRRGEMDLVVSWLPHGEPGLVTGPILSREPRVVGVATDHPLAHREAISVEDLAAYEVPMFDTIPKAFRDVWIPPRTLSGRSIPHRRFSEESIGDRGRMTSELLYLISTGRLVHPTVPSFAHMFGHPDIVYVTIADLPPMCSALIWRRRSLDHTGREFVRIAREVAAHARRRAAPGMKLES